MKLTSTIISIILLGLMSCKDIPDDIFMEYNATLQLNIKEIEKSIKTIKGKIKIEMYENPIATKKWYDKSNLASKYCDNVCGTIDSLIKRISSDSSKKYNTISEKEGSKLKSRINNLTDSLTHIIDNNEDKEIVSQGLSKTFSIFKNNEIRAFNSEKLVKYELISVLLKLILDIRHAELSTISLLNTNVGGSDSWSRIEPIVIPRTTRIGLDQNFEALIYYSRCDTIIDLTYEIDGKKFKPSGGVAKYRHKVTEEPGLIIKPGTLTINSRRTGLNYKLPFEIKYNVLPD